MAITLRADKGVALTHEELDTNFTTLAKGLHYRTFVLNTGGTWETRPTPFATATDYRLEISLSDATNFEEYLVGVEAIITGIDTSSIPINRTVCGTITTVPCDGLILLSFDRIIGGYNGVAVDTDYSSYVSIWIDALNAYTPLIDFEGTITISHPNKAILDALTIEVSYSPIFV